MKELLICKLVVEDKLIEQVMQFRYLGVDISSAHDLANDMRSQINKVGIPTRYSLVEPEYAYR